MDFGVLKTKETLTTELTQKLEEMKIRSEVRALTPRATSKDAELNSTKAMQVQTVENHVAPTNMPFAVIR